MLKCTNYGRMTLDSKLFMVKIITQTNIPKIYSSESATENAPNTGKSLSEALILGSTNAQYDKRLFIDLQVQYMKTTSSENLKIVKKCPV